jgi:hypothetical protein
MSEVMIGGLGELRLRGIGYPAALHEDTADDRGMERWRAILGTMIEGFEAHKKLADLDYDWRNKEEEARLQRVVARGMALFVEHYGSLWD